MSLHKLVKKDGENIVIDLFSGKRRPPNEEMYILCSLGIPKKIKNKDEK